MEQQAKKIWIFDSTLRDGAQGEEISFSVQDKLNIVQTLDQLGIDYIEAGNPGSNPKDLEFFERVEKLITGSDARRFAIFTIDLDKIGRASCRERV